jgi:hypothetical protein
MAIQTAAHATRNAPLACRAKLPTISADNKHVFTIVAYGFRLSVELDLRCAKTDEIGAPIHDDYLWRMP